MQLFYDFILILRLVRWSTFWKKSVKKKKFKIESKYISTFVSN